MDCGVKARYGSALKPRFCKASYGDSGLVDRHERLNPVEKRQRMDQCQFANSSMTANHLVTVHEARPMSANTQAKNTAFNGKQQKKCTDVKRDEIIGSNLIAQVEQTMKSLLKTENERRARILDAVLGSRQARQCIHGYKDNDVTYRLTNGKHTQFSTYKPEMGPTIAALASKAPHPDYK